VVVDVSFVEVDLAVDLSSLDDFDRILLKYHVLNRFLSGDLIFIVMDKETFVIRVLGKKGFSVVSNNRKSSFSCSFRFLNRAKKFLKKYGCCCVIRFPNGRVGFCFDVFVVYGLLSDLLG